MYKIFVLIFCMICLSSNLYGQDSGDSLIEVGMDYNQVLKALGPPEMKHEYESKREDLWVYEETRIWFKEGRVMDIGSREIGSDYETLRKVSPDQALRELPEPTLRPDPKGLKSKKTSDVPVKDIFSEVLRGMSTKDQKQGLTRGRPGVPSLIK